MDYIIAVIGGGVGAAVISLISALLTTWQKRKYAKEDKRDELAEAVQGLRNDVCSLRESIDRRDAVQARTHILRFDDELLSKVKHSREYFKQILEDIDTYEKYVDTHQGFVNGYTTAAVEHIRGIYKQCLEENSFI